MAESFLTQKVELMQAEASKFNANRQTLELKLRRLYFALLWKLPKEALIFMVNNQDIVLDLLSKGRYQEEFTYADAVENGMSSLVEMRRMFKLIAECWEPANVTIITNNPEGPGPLIVEMAIP